MTRSRFFRMANVLLALALVQVACQPQTVIVKETKVVQEVEKEVEKVVVAEATKPPEPVTITLLWHTSDPRLDEIVNKLNEVSEVYTIELDLAPPGEYWTVLYTRIAAGDAPDLIRMDQSNLSRFAAQGSLLDIDACQNIDPNHPALDFDDYFDVTLDAYTYLGKRYGLPYYAVTQMLYVNQDHLAEEGIGLDGINNWDWDELQQIAAILTNEERQGFLGYDGFPLGEFSGPMVEWRTMMRDGSVSMIMDWASIDYEAEEEQNIAAYLLPKGDSESRDTSAVTGGLSIAATTQHANVACQAFMDLVQALHDSEAFAPRESLLTPQRIASMLAYKAGTSADNIVASAMSMHGMAWVYALEPDIGDAQAVAGNPMMLAGASTLRPVLDQSGAKVNLAGTVRVLDGSKIVRLAPVSPESLPLDTGGFWDLVEDKGGLVVGVLVSGDDSYAVRVEGSAQEAKVFLVAPDGARQPAVEGIVAELEGSVSIPIAGIDEGSWLCRLAWDGLQTVFHC